MQSTGLFSDTGKGKWQDNDIRTYIPVPVKRGVNVSGITVAHDGTVTLAWVPVPGVITIHATDDLALPVAKWVPIQETPGLILRNSTPHRAELSSLFLSQLFRNTDRLFFTVSAVE